MYRWQDPAPAPVVAIRERRKANAATAIWNAARMQAEQAPAKRPGQVITTNYGPAVPLIPSMTIDGVEYVEQADADRACGGCAFAFRRGGCAPVCDVAAEVFGGDCEERQVIYIHKA